jgi:hypothetical protein
LKDIHNIKKERRYALLYTYPPQLNYFQNFLVTFLLSKQLHNNLSNIAHKGFILPKSLKVDAKIWFALRANKVFM